jgi:hypothetical protein
MERGDRLRLAIRLALVVAFAGACGVDAGGAPTSFSMALSLPAGLPIDTVTLTVLGADGSCNTTTGDATGTPLANLSNISLMLGTPKQLTVSSGTRTFQVIGSHGAAPLARGCATKTLTAGGHADVMITLVPIAPGGSDAGPDGMMMTGDSGPMPDAPPPPPDAPPPPPDAPPTPPPNDTCPTATFLTDGIALPGTLTAATDDVTLSCGDAGAGDVFYQITLLAPHQVTITLTSGVDTALAVYDGACGALVEQACAQMTPTGEQIVIPNLPAGSYYVVVEGVGGATGNFSIGYVTGLRPPNDQCAGAIALTDGVTRLGDLVLNALDDSSGVCGGAGSGDVVYSFTVGPGAERAQLHVANAMGFDPVIHVQSTTCGAGAEVGCANFQTTGDELLDLPDLAPGTYYAWVDGAGAEAAPGSFDITLNLLPAVLPPPNDQCTGAITLVPGAAATMGSTVGAADDYAPTCLASDSTDTTYKFTLASAQQVILALVPSTPWNAALTLVNGMTCDTSSTVSCVDGAFATRYINRKSLAAGSYDVIVDGAAGAVGDYTVALTTGPTDATFGYYKIDTSSPYVDIAATGTMVAIPLTNWGVDAGTGAGDEWTLAIPLPFAIDYYGTTYAAGASLTVSANGYLTFGAAAPGMENWVNDCPLDSTAPNDALALFWDDQISTNQSMSKLYTKVEGTAPYRRFIVEYQNFDGLACNGGGTCYRIEDATNQQAILYENGDLEFHYGPRATPTTLRNCSAGTGGTTGQQGAGLCATLGLEGQVAGMTDVDGAQCNTNTPPVVDGRDIYWVHPR